VLLRQDAYFESLLQAAHNIGAISDDEVKRIQLECLYLLEEKTKKFTSGSSSVLIDDAENIMKSNLYIIGLHLKSFLDTDHAIEAIKVTPISELYALGGKTIKTKLNVARHLYLNVLKNMTDVDYDYYTFTLTKSVKQFFDLYTDYYTWYNAHELPDGAIFAYPICYSGYIGEQVIFAATHANDFVGIEYVLRYLQAIYYENIFCKNFDSEAIRCVLLDYHTDYNSILFNIFEKILAAAIGCIIVGEKAESLCISKDRLEMAFVNKSPDEIECMLHNACTKLTDEIELNNVHAQEYVKKSVTEIFNIKKLPD